MLVFAVVAAAAADIGIDGPQTAYQWSGTGWVATGYDESASVPGYMPGPMPTEAGTFPGELKFVPCQAA